MAEIIGSIRDTSPDEDSRAHELLVLRAGLGEHLFEHLERGRAVKLLNQVAAAAGDGEQVADRPAPLRKLWCSRARCRGA